MVNNGNTPIERWPTQDRTTTHPSAEHQSKKIPETSTAQR